MTLIRPFIAKSVAILLSSMLLTACGGESTSDDDSLTNELCNKPTEQVNWEALLTADCDSLFSYNLFKDKMDPTQSPNQGGVKYDLAVSLFADYATKYRFAFIPAGVSAAYNTDEVFDFPVGSVLVKTFAMPANTSDRQGQESLIETRLLIHREDGWVSLPYYWQDNTDAILTPSGKIIDSISTTHNGESLEFQYEIPSQSDCDNCHSIHPINQGDNDTRTSLFLPIGAKARYLNFELSYDDTTQNQLTYWQDKGLLSGMPDNIDSIDKVVAFKDNSTISNMPHNDIVDAARGYLDINCAHCHRAELTIGDYGGRAYTDSVLEYNRNYLDDPLLFGTCEESTRAKIAGLEYNLVPGDAESSYLLYRMESNDPYHAMPELGRQVIHKEGVDLVKYWINNLPKAACSPI